MQRNGLFAPSKLSALGEEPPVAVPAAGPVFEDTSEECCSLVGVLESLFTKGQMSTLRDTAFWPAKCQWLDVLFDEDFYSRGKKSHFIEQLKLFPLVCKTWPILQPNLRGITTEVGADIWPSELGWHQRLVDGALPLLPGTSMSFAQYATMVQQRVVCESYHRNRSPESEGTNWTRADWAPICGWDEFQARGTCDCLGLLLANLAKLRTPLLQLSHRDGAGESEEQVHRSLFSTGGFTADPNVHFTHLDTLLARGATEPWGRFLFYVRQHDPEEASVERNIKFGSKQAEYAHRLAALIAAPDAPRTVRELMEVAGNMRMDGAQQVGSEGGGMSRPLATRVVLRDAAHHKSLHTQLAGKYGRQWNETLLRRLEEGRRPIFFEPAGFENGGDGGTHRARSCGTVVTHDTLPWNRCEAFLREFAVGVEVPT
eukprot:4624355-Prymnesium_polylepis.1